MKPKKNFTRSSLFNKALEIFSAYIVKYCNNPIEGDGSFQIDLTNMFNGGILKTFTLK